jgi:peptidoglycan/LPS O-acetylase OafA/YrhL
VNITSTHTRSIPPPRPSTTSRYYRPELDVLRLFAFLSVFLVHRMDFLPIDPAKHFWLYNFCLLGDFGVPVFFLLSAFLITELLLRENDQAGTIHVKAFYMRRILRIWPLYFAVFFGLVLLARFLHGAGPTVPASWLAFTLFAGNWYISRYGWIPAYPVNPLWSISVEEQFYIAIPILAAYGGRSGLKAVSLFLLAIAYVLVINYARHPTNRFSSQWTNSFVQFQFFSAGTLLSLYLNGRLPQWHVTVRMAAAVAAVGFWLAASLIFGVQADTPHSATLGAPIGWALLLAGTLLLFLSLLGIAPKYLPKPLVYLGRISYGLYVFHELVYFLVFKAGRRWLTHFSNVLHLPNWRNGIGTVFALGLTILVAHLSYRFYERPFLSLKKRFTFVPSRD